MIAAKKFHRLFLYLGAFLVLMGSSADLSAKTMTFFNNPGLPPTFSNPRPNDWSNPANWIGGSPGGEIMPGDEVHIVGFCHMDQTVLNRGRIRIKFDVGSLTGITPTLVVMPGVTLTNNGTIYTVNTDTDLKVRGFLNNPSYNGIECKGRLINEGGTINNTGAIWVRPSGDFHNNSGTFDNYGTLQNQGTITNAATTNMYNNSLFSLFAPSSALTEGTFTWFGGYININSDVTLNVGAGQTLSQGSEGTLRNWGTLNISGHYETAGPLEINAGRVNINNGGKFTRKAGGRFAGRLDLNAYGELVLEDGRPLPNTLVWHDEGTVTIAGEYYHSINVPVGGYLDIAPTGIYRIGQVFGTVLQINAATNVTNNGTIRLMDRGEILITAPNAVLPARTGATFSWESGGEVSVAMGKTLYVDPSISVPAGGILNLGGKLNITNAFTIAGTLNLGEHSEVIGSPNLNIYGKLVYVNANAPAVRNFLPFRVNFMNSSVLEVQSLIELNIADQQTFSTLSNYGTVNIANQQTFSILSNYGTVNINSGGNLISKGVLNPFLQPIGALYNYGTLNLNWAGKLTFNAIEYMPGGTFNWNGGGIVEVGLSGRLQVASGAPLTIPSGKELSVLGSLVSVIGSPLITINGILRNAGTVELNSTWMQNNGSIFNNGTFTINPEGRLYNSNILDNNGVLNLNADSRLTQDGMFTNTGDLNLNYDGRLVLNNATTRLPLGNFNWFEGGKLFIGAGATMLLGTALDIPFNAHLYVNGELLILPVGTLNVNQGATLHNLGTLTNDGFLNLKDQGSLRIYYSAATNIHGGEFNWFSGASVNITNGASYSPPTEFTVPTGGTLYVGGTFTNPANNNFMVDGTVSITPTGEILNNGTLNLKGDFAHTQGGKFTNSSTGQLNIFSPGKFLNAESATFLNQAGGIVNNSGEMYNLVDATMTNEGVLSVLTGGSITSYANGIILNKGTLTNAGNISNGGAFFTNGGTFTNLNSFDNNFQGTASNSGLWQDETNTSINVANNGTFNLLVGGHYLMNAPETQWPKGTFNWAANSEVTVGEASTVAYPGFSDLEIGIDRTLIINGQLIMESARSFNHGTITGTGLFSAYIDFSTTGVIAPGNSVGELTFEGTLNLNDGTYACEIGGGFINHSDLLIIDGSPSLEYGKLLVTWISPPVHEARYTVMTYIGGPTASYFDPEDIIIPEVEGFTFEKIITTSEVIIVASETVLPVELMQFTGTKSGKTTLLAWRTATEQNNEGFSVERLGTANNQWAEIGFTPGAGTSTATQAYNFTDLAPQGGENFYRLRQLDFSGDFTYSAIVTVRFDEEDALVIYPNPVGARLRVLNAEEGEYQVFNAVGQALLRGDLGHDIDVSRLPAGTYFLKVAARTERFFKR